jgi:hypothetical protein
MTAPNLKSPNSVTAKLWPLAIGTSPTAIVTAASDTAVKVNTLTIANVDGTNAATVNVEIYRSSTAHRIAFQINVPAASTLEVLKGAIYLEEGDALRLTASANGDLEGVASGEVIA